MLPTYSGDGCHNLSKFKFVENCCLAGSVQPHHQDPHLLLAKEPFEEGSKKVPHSFPFLSPLLYQHLSESVNSGIIWLKDLQHHVSTCCQELRLTLITLEYGLKF